MSKKRFPAKRGTYRSTRKISRKLDVPFKVGGKVFQRRPKRRANG